ncbi:MAG: TrbG/VirB9 family P-type conjugative transfer protein [Acidaminococcaceae bacterium]|nr:TrbG/VirB9 family P-type conjugative transfer protein [Acidaminococcaceae bacterium]
MKKKFLGSIGRLVVGGVIIGMSQISFAAGWQKPVYVPSDGESKGARVTYEYKDDSLFYVNTKLGFVNDIELRPGEVVTHIAGGDTKRWLIDKAIVGNVQHVYIKPIEPDIDTNIIINTNQRAYRLYVVVSNDYDPLISFTFPDSPASGQRLRVPEDNPPVYGDRVNKNYEIRVKKKADKSLIPLEIFDDGRQTFIRISKDNKYDLPVLYSIDPWNKKNIAMVNYRVKGEYIIADGVYPHGRLFYQQKFWIDFFNLEKKKTVKGTMPANRPERTKRTQVVYDDTEEESDDFETSHTSEESRALEESRKREEARRLEEASKLEEARRLEEASKREEARRLEEARALERERREAEALKREQERQELIRQQQLQKEQEKQERIRQQKEREREELLIRQEREKEELLKQQREKERLERIKEQELQKEQERLERLREQQLQREQAEKERELIRRQEEEKKQQLLREERMRRQQAAEREELIRRQQVTEQEEAERQKKLAREERAKARAAEKERRVREREERRKRTKEEQQIEDFRKKKQAEAQKAYSEAVEKHGEMYREASADEGADDGVAPVDKETKEKIYQDALKRQQMYDDLYKEKGRKKKAGDRR